MADSRKTIFHAYAIVPLLAICLAHALVWLSTKSLADFSRAFDVTLGIDALFPLRPEWVIIYVATFLFWGLGRAAVLPLRRGRRHRRPHMRRHFPRLPELHPAPRARPLRGRLYLGSVGRVFVRYADKLLPVDALPVRLPRVPSVAAHAKRTAAL